MKKTGRRTAFVSAAAAAAASEGPLGFGQRLASIPGLFLDVMLGRFDGVSRGRIFLMVGALFYIVSPIDFLPEILLTFPGLADDAVVAAWLVAAMYRATTAYALWRLDRGSARASGPAGSVIVGEVVR